MDMHGITIVTGQLIESEEVDPPEGAILFSSERLAAEGGVISVALIPPEAPMPAGWQLLGWEAGQIVGDPDDAWMAGEDGRQVPILRAVILQGPSDPGVPDGQWMLAVVPEFIASIGGAS